MREGAVFIRFVGLLVAAALVLAVFAHWILACINPFYIVVGSEMWWEAIVIPVGVVISLVALVHYLKRSLQGKSTER